MGEKLSAETGKPFNQAGGGEYVAGTIGQRLTLASAVRNARRRPRLPTRALDAALEKAPPTPRLRAWRGGGIDWSFARQARPRPPELIIAKDCPMSATKILGTDNRRLLIVSHDLDPRPMSPGASASRRNWARPGSPLGFPVLSAALPSGGGMASMPMPHLHRSAPTSRRLAASSRLWPCHRHVGLARARRKTSNLRFGALGKCQGFARPVCSVRAAWYSVSHGPTIYAMTARSMCCALPDPVGPRRRPGRSIAFGLAWLRYRSRHQGRELAAHRRFRVSGTGACCCSIRPMPNSAAYNPLLEVRRGEWGARRPEHRRHPRRPEGEPGETQSLGKDQPRPAGRRDPPCPLRRGETRRSPGSPPSFRSESGPSDRPSPR